MLEKNKDYIEMRVSSIDYTFTQNAATQINIDGYVYSTYFGLPNPGEPYVIISKEKFEALQTKNEQLKKKLEEFFTTLYPEDDVERLVWATEQICCGQVSVNGWMASAKFWKKRYDDFFKLVGFSSKEEVEDYLVNEAKCDTLHEAILKLIDENKYACEEWCRANSSNNSWKATAECNSPKELMTKLNQLRDDIKEWKEKYDLAVEMIGRWQRATGQFLPNIYDEELASWKEVTGFKTPEEAKDYWTTKLSELGEVNETFAREVRSWRGATGCKTPEEANELINNFAKKVFNYENRLDSDKQSASIAIRHLDNIAFRDDKRSDWSDK